MNSIWVDPEAGKWRWAQREGQCDKWHRGLWMKMSCTQQTMAGPLDFILDCNGGQGRVRAVNGLDRDQSGKRKEATTVSQAKRSRWLEPGRSSEGGEGQKPQVELGRGIRTSLHCGGWAGSSPPNTEALNCVLQEGLERRLQVIPSSQGSGLCEMP